jgi:hypothetical protein
VLSTVNVPGRVIHVIDAEHVLTVEAERTLIERELEDCIAEHPGFTDREGPGSCRSFKQTMHKVRLRADEATIEASVLLTPDGYIVAKAFGPDTAVFAIDRAVAWQENEFHVITVGGLSDGDLKQGTLAVGNLRRHGWTPQVFVHDDQAMILSHKRVRRFDIADPTRPLQVDEPEPTACSPTSFSVGDHILCGADEGFGSVSFTP